MRCAHKMDEITQRARVSIFRRKIARALPATVHSQQQVTLCQKRLVNWQDHRATEQLLMVSKRKAPFSSGKELQQINPLQKIPRLAQWIFDSPNSLDTISLLFQFFSATIEGFQQWSMNLSSRYETLPEERTRART